ncbi:MAG: hypothetical protein K2H47_03060 [Muribaculaceae bacterium]|nr:hypothetical protein [Muribaculaceae bacterium]
MKLKDVGNIPFRLSVLQSVFPNNTAITAKAKRLEDAGDIVRLKPGLYVISPTISEKMVNEFLIANHLHGPSYVSMQTALRYYGLIPEHVVEIISLTPRRAKTFSNKIGRFKYVHCPDSYFPIGITSIIDESVSFLIATPEKALCDLMSYTANLNLRYISEIRTYIKEDLRMEREDIIGLNTEILRECACVGRKKTMINQLIKFIEYERNV